MCNLFLRQVLILSMLTTIIPLESCKKKSRLEGDVMSEITQPDLENSGTPKDLTELHLSSTSAPEGKIFQIKLCHPDEDCQHLSLSGSQLQMIFRMPDFFSVRSCKEITTECDPWQFSIIRPPTDLSPLETEGKTQSITTTTIALNDIHGFSIIKFNEGGRILVRYTLLSQVIEHGPEVALELAGTGLRNSGNLCFLNSSLQFWYSNESFRQQILDANLKSHKFIKGTEDITIKSARQSVIFSLKKIFEEWNKPVPDLEKIEKNKLLFQRSFDVAILDESITPIRANESVQEHMFRMLRALEDQGRDPYFTTYGNQSQKSGKDLVEVFFSDYLGFSGNNQKKGVRIGAEYSMDFDDSVKARSNLFSVSTVILQTHGKSEKMQDIIYRQFDSFTTTSLDQLNEGMSQYRQNQTDFLNRGGCNAIGSCFQRSVIYSEGLDDITFNAPEKLKSPDGRNYLQRTIEVAEELEIPYMDSSRGEGRYLQKMELTSVMIRDWDGVTSGHWYSFVKEGGKWYEYNDLTAREVNWSYVKSKSENYGMVFKYNKKSGFPPVPFQNSQRPYQVLSKTNSYMDFNSKKDKYIAFDESSSKYSVVSGTGDQLKKYQFNQTTGLYEDVTRPSSNSLPATESYAKSTQVTIDSPDKTNIKSNAPNQPTKNSSGFSGMIKMGSLVFIAIGGIVGISHMTTQKENK